MARIPNHKYGHELLTKELVIRGGEAYLVKHTAMYPMNGHWNVTAMQWDFVNGGWKTEPVTFNVHSVELVRVGDELTRKLFKLGSPESKLAFQTAPASRDWHSSPLTHSYR